MAKDTKEVDGREGFYLAAIKANKEHLARLEQALKDLRSNPAP